jgi:DNA-binding CsgD family transcriptional regulator
MADLVEILRLRKEKLSYRAIGAQVGLSKERVRQILYAEGVFHDPVERREKSEARRQLILKLNSNGLTQQQIADRLGLKAHTSVGDILRRSGVSRWEEQRLRNGVNDQAILRLRNKGLTYRQIADQLRLPTTSAVYQSLKRSGATTANTTIRLDLDEAIRLRHAGLSHGEIARLLGASVSVVSNALSRAGVVERRRKD